MHGKKTQLLVNENTRGNNLSYKKKVSQRTTNEDNREREFVSTFEFQIDWSHVLVYWFVRMVFCHGRAGVLITEVLFHNMSTKVFFISEMKRTKWPRNICIQKYKISNCSIARHLTKRFKSCLIIMGVILCQKPLLVAYCAQSIYDTKSPGNHPSRTLT